MNAKRDEGHRPSTLQARLRREARATRPGFSPRFQERLLDRIARGNRTVPTLAQSDSPRRAGVSGPMVIAVSFAGLATVVMAPLVAAWPTGTRPGPTEPAAERGAIVIADSSTVIGVESIPLYDDIDAEMRSGAWMLAASLVELPDWASLADFDATAIRADASGP